MIQKQGKRMPVPPDDAYFGGKPPLHRIEPMSEAERESIEQIDTTTPEGKLEKYRTSSNIRIARFTIAMLEHETDEAFVAHLNTLIVSEITFVAGMARYLGVDDKTVARETATLPPVEKVGRLFVANATFMKEYENAKSMD